MDSNNLFERLEQVIKSSINGNRPYYTFREAAERFIKENSHKRSLKRDIQLIRILDPYIGVLSLDLIHMGTLQIYINERKKEKVKTRTINMGLQVVRRILNLASTEWFDENGLTWIASAPKIKLMKEHDKGKPYPLSWEEQDHLFAYLPTHLRQMSLFAVNTGCRDQEICQLKWDWEVYVSQLDTSVFIVPADIVKNGHDRVIILNDSAMEAINKQRGIHEEFVFTYRGKSVKHMLNSAWKNARIKAGLEKVRVHDLKHTFGRRLRAAGVSLEDRQDLLGHKSNRITTHYSAAELNSLIIAANKVCYQEGAPTLTLLKLVKITKSEKDKRAYREIGGSCASRTRDQRIKSPSKSARQSLSTTMRERVKMKCIYFCNEKELEEKNVFKKEYDSQLKSPASQLPEPKEECFYSVPLSHMPVS
jgi:integrase